MMRTFIITLITFFAMAIPCYASHFTFLAKDETSVTFMYNDDIHVSGELYQFYTVTRDFKNETDVVLGVIANNRTKTYVFYSGAIETADGHRFQSKGDSIVRTFQPNSVVDRAIKVIDGRINS